MQYDLTAGWMRYPGSGGTTYDTILNIENLTTAGGADVIGTSGANVITDHSAPATTPSTPGGNDTINARAAGNDTINAGSGNDTVDAGDGNDTIIDTEGMSAER